LQRLSISDFEVKAAVINADPFCDWLEWTFNVTATDVSGRSEPVQIDVFIMFGNPEISDTRCDSTPFGVEELEDYATHIKLALVVYDYGRTACRYPYE
jgi:hypothetical protein